MEIAQNNQWPDIDVSMAQVTNKAIKYCIPRNFVVAGASAFAAWYVPLFLQAYSGHIFQKSSSSLFPDVNLFGHNVFSIVLSPFVYPEVPVKDLALKTRIPAFFITSFTLNVLAQVIFGDKEKNMRPNQNVQQPAITASSMNAEPVRQVSDSSISKKDMAIVETKN